MATSNFLPLEVLSPDTTITTSTFFPTQTTSLDNTNITSETSSPVISTLIYTLPRTTTDNSALTMSIFSSSTENTRSITEGHLLTVTSSLETSETTTSDYTSTNDDPSPPRPISSSSLTPEEQVSTSIISTLPIFRVTTMPIVSSSIAQPDFTEPTAEKFSTVIFALPTLEPSTPNYTIITTDNSLAKVSITSSSATPSTYERTSPEELATEVFWSLSSLKTTDSDYPRTTTGMLSSTLSEYSSSVKPLDYRRTTTQQYPSTVTSTMETYNATTSDYMFSSESTQDDTSTKSEELTSTIITPSTTQYIHPKKTSETKPSIMITTSEGTQDFIKNISNDSVSTLASSFSSSETTPYYKEILPSTVTKPGISKTTIPNNHVTSTNPLATLSSFHETTSDNTGTSSEEHSSTTFKTSSREFTKRISNSPHISVTTPDYRRQTLETKTAGSTSVVSNISTRFSTFPSLNSTANYSKITFEKRISNQSSSGKRVFSEGFLVIIVSILRIFKF